jgi:hypothetical protein
MELGAFTCASTLSSLLAGMFSDAFESGLAACSKERFTSPAAFSPLRS